MSISSSSTARFAHVGPYEAWMLGTGRDHDFFSLPNPDNRPHLPTVFAWASGADAAQRAKIAARPDVHLAGLWAPLMTGNPKFLPGLLPTPADISAMEAKGTDIEQDCGASVSAGFPLEDRSVDATFAERQTLAVEGPAPKVIVACIDDGIAFAHEAFRNSLGTCRIAAHWAQGADAATGGSVLFGREITGPEITALAATHGTDEDAIYRASGMTGGRGTPVSPVVLGTSHGSHVAGLLARDLDADDMQMITVDLPTASTWDTSGFGKTMFVLAALHYIFTRADQIAAAHGVASLPLVINMSYGHSAGPHDGTSIVEAALDEMITARRAVAPTALVLPAGNLHLDRLHAQLTQDALTGQPAKLAWRVQPNDRTSTFAEIWLPDGLDQQSVGVTLRAPDGQEAYQWRIGENGDPDAVMSRKILRGGDAVGQVTLGRSEGGRWHWVIALAPTETSDAALVPAPAGRWEIEIETATSAHHPDTPIMLWIQRDVSYGIGNTGAKQSYFDDPENALFTPRGAIATRDAANANVLVRRFGCISGMATGSTALVVGCAIGPWADCVSSPFSGSGDLALQNGSWVAVPGTATAVSALADTNELSPGVAGIGTRSGSLTKMRGTSMASPMVASAIAKALCTATQTDAAAAAQDNYLPLLQSAGRIRPLTHSGSVADVMQSGAGVLT